MVRSMLGVFELDYTERSSSDSLSRNMNRRVELLETALRLFADAGYEGTSVADVVGELGLSKAAFGYHFSSKDDLLIELATPLLDALDELMDSYPKNPQWPGEIELMVSDYIDVLIAHRDIVVWVDADKAVVNHPIVGERLHDNHLRMRRALRADSRSASSRVLSSSALGVIWRPIRNLTDVDDQRESILEAALSIVSIIRS